MSEALNWPSSRFLFVFSELSWSSFASTDRSYNLDLMHISGILGIIFVIEAPVLDLARGKCGIIIQQIIAHWVCGSSSSVLMKMRFIISAILKPTFLLRTVEIIAFQWTFSVQIFPRVCIFCFEDFPKVALFIGCLDLHVHWSVCNWVLDFECFQLTGRCIWYAYLCRNCSTKIQMLEGKKENLEQWDLVSDSVREWLFTEYRSLTNKTLHIFHCKQIPYYSDTR